MQLGLKFTTILTFSFELSLFKKTKNNIVFMQTTSTANYAVIFDSQLVKDFSLGNERSFSLPMSPWFSIFLSCLNRSIDVYKIQISGMPSPWLPAKGAKGTTWWARPLPRSLQSPLQIDTVTDCGRRRCPSGVADRQQKGRWADGEGTADTSSHSEESDHSAHFQMWLLDLNNLKYEKACL